MKPLINFSHHLLSNQSYSNEARDLASVINQIVLASKIISREINKAGLVDILGSTGKTNIQEEEVQKLDEYTDQLMTDLLRQIPQIRAVGSEEMEEICDFQEHKNTGKYIVLSDPLDGSSNIGVNVSVGTIFVIFKKKSKGSKLLKSDYLQPGQQAVAAGYILYGSSTMLVYSTGYGVHGFTLDQSIGEFILSHENIKISQKLKYYSTNEAYEPLWNKQTKKFVSRIKQTPNIKARFVGSMVADCHRNLLEGGVFILSGDKKNPNGKLRLMFEVIPFSFLNHQAGGYASNGTQDILNIQPKKLHQRVPIFIGNKEDVKRVEKIK
ncbi:MAG: class 1 fructose-bisphosphatase [Patescibacteria group bacterium]